MDTLITLARKVLIVSNPLSIDSAFEYLKRGEGLLLPRTQSSESDDDPAELRSRWEYVRVLSGAFYSLSAVLCQAQRYAHATRFLERACTLGAESLAGYPGLRKDKGKEQERVKNEINWGSLEEQLYKRWEILGVCHLRGGDRKVCVFTVLCRKFAYDAPFSSHLTHLSRPFKLILTLSVTAGII